MARKRRGQNDAQPAIFVAATPDTDFFGLGSIPFPNSFKLGTRPPTNGFRGCSCRGHSTLFSLPRGPGHPERGPSTPAKVGQAPTSDLEPTNSHHRHDERPCASPVSTSRSSASSPPVTSATPSPGARVSLSVLTSSSHKIQPQVINSHVALEPKPRLVEGRMTCLSLVVTRRKGAIVSMATINHPHGRKKTTNTEAPIVSQPTSKPLNPTLYTPRLPVPPNRNRPNVNRLFPNLKSEEPRRPGATK